MPHLLIQRGIGIAFFSQDAEKCQSLGVISVTEVKLGYEIEGIFVAQICRKRLFGR